MSESATLLAALDEKIAAAEETLRTLRDARTALLRRIENDRLDAHLARLPDENDDMRKFIDEVERLDREATPGPWHRRDAETENGYVTSAVSLDTADEDGLTPCDLPIVGRTITAGIAGNDAALIAHYRTAAPLLAAEVRRLRAEVLSWTRTAAMHEHMYLEIAAENEDLRLTLAAEQGRQEGAPIESNEAADEYDYTRCICLDSVSRWCPTCGEEYAERRAAMLAADAATG